MAPLIIDSHIVLPAHELSFDACRSSGPGGQNVNKVESKVSLKFELEKSGALSDDVKRRLAELVAVNSEGQIIIRSQRTRDQSRNLEDARERLRLWVLAALAPETPRIPTRTPKRAKRRRLDDKRRLSEKKARRRISD